MRGTAGGADQCNGGTASASSVGIGGGSSAANAFNNNDGGDGLWWSSSTGSIGGAEWLQYTFPSAITVEELRLVFYSKSNLPTEIRVQYWDGAAWQTYWLIDFLEYAWGSLTRVFNRADAALQPPTFSVWPTISTNTGFYGEGDIATVADRRRNLEDLYLCLRRCRARSRMHRDGHERLRQRASFDFDQYHRHPDLQYAYARAGR
jgi:hypothetical protein